MVKTDRKKIGMLALLGVLIMVAVLVSGCTKSPAETTPTDAQDRGKLSDPDNPGRSLTSILSEYQGMVVILRGEQLFWASGTLKEVNENYIVIERTEEGRRYQEAVTTPISHISSIKVGMVDGKISEINILIV